MDTISAGQSLIEFLKLCYAADRPVLLVGRHGIGKSDLLAQAAREMNIGFVCRDLSLMEAPDLLGLPKITGKNTVYAPPQFLPTKGSGLLVFEELNRCESHMQAPCLQLLTARSLNDYELPRGWLPVAAVNPDDEDYTTNPLDPALRSRFVQVQVLPDREEWLIWARRSGLHPSAIRYVESDESVFDHRDSNPRAWHYVSDLLNAVERERADSSSLRPAVLGVLGDQRGSAFLRTLQQTTRPLTADEITSSYHLEHRSEVRLWIEQGRIDLVELSLRSLLTFLQPRDEFEAMKSSQTLWENIARFLADLPGDLKEEATFFFEERDYEIPQMRRRRWSA